eukprot:12510258-Ditylum_brightwellii.AAC.1
MVNCNGPIIFKVEGRPRWEGAVKCEIYLCDFLLANGVIEDMCITLGAFTNKDCFDRCLLELFAFDLSIFYLAYEGDAKEGGKKVGSSLQWWARIRWSFGALEWQLAMPCQTQ